MLKVFTTEALWEIVNHAFQIHGGAAYFTDLPLERMLRHARINQIGEGANEVLTSFIALVGMRGPGVEPREIWVTLHHPSSARLRKAWRIGLGRAGAAVRPTEVPVQSPETVSFAQQLARLIRRFHVAVDRELIHHRDDPRPAVRAGAHRTLRDGALRVGLRAEPLRCGTASWRRRLGKRPGFSCACRSAVPAGFSTTSGITTTKP